ncbi:hypothetical protein [Kitasatospora sp. NPDC094011]|uniref:hypothetical protein n=1 Tax=Kitasatospora sp. NPDC094011 TaxID=3364090 RepID=UPI003804AA12
MIRKFSIRRPLTLGASVIALAALAAGPVAAAENTSPKLSGCITWIDSAGPGGAGRGHAKCAGMNVYVVTTVHCADGSSSTSFKRWEYAKAECSYGVKARYVTYKATKS